MTLPTEDDRKAARELLDMLYAAIKHGDAAHQDWLRGILDAYETVFAQFRADAMRVEREACARVAERCSSKHRVNHTGDDYLDYVNVYEFGSIGPEIAQAIRERGGDE